MPNRAQRALDACVMLGAVFGAGWGLTALAAAQDGAPATITQQPVFPVPPAEELAKISHPAVRTDLLDMAGQDQVARKKGK